MRKIFLSTLVLFLTTSIYSQKYNELVKTGNKWNYLTNNLAACWCEVVRTYSLSITTDTLIGNVIYKKVMCEEIGEYQRKTVYGAALREDIVGKKVFIKYPSSPEKILYDFNYKVGDTVSIKIAIDSTKTINRVKSIETYSMNGYSGNKFLLCDTIENIGYKYESDTEIWYEGIGSNKMLFYLPQLLDNTTLLCFWSQENIIYHDSNWIECEYAYTKSGLEENSLKSRINIYPNPTSNSFTIDTDLDIENIKIFSILGNLLLETNKKNVDISKLSKGSYILKVILSSGETQELKLIKNYR